MDLLCRPGARAVLLVALVASGAAAALLWAPHSPAGLHQLGTATGAWAPVAFLSAWIVGTVVLFPGTALAAAGGLLFGPLLGAGLSLAGALLGATAAFALSRRGLHGWVTRSGGRRLRVVNDRLEREGGFVAVLCLRLAPGVPATALHYAAGASKIRLRSFVPAVALGSAPRVFAYAALGGSLSALDSPAAIAGLVVIALATVGGTVAAWRLRRRWRAA